MSIFPRTAVQNALGRLQHTSVCSLEHRHHLCQTSSDPKFDAGTSLDEERRLCQPHVHLQSFHDSVSGHHDTTAKLPLQARKADGVVLLKPIS